MRTGLITTALVLLLSQLGWAISNAEIIPAEWPVDSTFEFAILDAQGVRRATAYYRILQEESEGRPTYRFKYMGKNEELQESSECVAFRDTLKPLRSTRKVVSGNNTFYQDIAYAEGKVIIRNKYEGQEVQEREQPIQPGTFDYEQLIWIIGQLDFERDNQLTLNLFSMLTEAQATLIITDTGYTPLAINNYTFNARLYSFDVNLSPYLVYTVIQDGLEIPARIDMGDSTFINMRIDSAKVTNGFVVDPTPEQPGEEQPEPTPPSGNPLGPPPPGSRY